MADAPTTQEAPAAAPVPETPPIPQAAIPKGGPATPTSGQKLYPVGIAGEKITEGLDGLRERLAESPESAGCARRSQTSD